MTEVATVPQATALAVPSAAGAPALNLTATTVSLLEWAQELDAAHRLGTALCGTEFVPASFRGKPDAAAAAILAGKSLGLDPMNSLSNIFVVQGRPAMYARTMVALVLSAGHDIRRTAATPEAVTILGRRKGQQEWQEFTWTIDRARQAGYLSNKKYTSDPIAMLTAKAQAEACRTIAPDVLTGVAAYSVEDVELEDLGETPTAPAAAPAVAKPARTIKRRAAAPAPEVPDVVAEPPAPEEEPEPPAGPVDTETGELPPERDWFAEIDLAAGDVTALRALWTAARDAGADPETLDAIASAATAAKDQ
ncbi:hypothetical protein ACFFON_15305 [Arthrobacter citreus]|uniref:hypothetical protein n=1 Tax=Arthrobacter TaxID=1663 RepID=UPI0012649698|nr:hypothetical protein [Arthrobacter gandavensis]